MPSAQRRPFHALLTLAACAAALTAHPVTAQGTPIGFEESYALADAALVGYGALTGGCPMSSGGHSPCMR